MEKTELVLTLPIGPPAYAHGVSPRHCYYAHLSIIIFEFLKIVIAPRLQFQGESHVHQYFPVGDKNRLNVCTQ